MDSVRATLALFVFMCSASSAQQASNQTTTEPEKLVVTVTARPTPAEASGTDITVIDGQDSRAAVQPSLADLLRFEPGLHVTRNGFRGAPTWVSLRGGDPNFTLFLIDGIPVNDITDQLGGTVDLATIVPFNASRVEVVRGPVSAMYGSDAMSGVVNVVSAEDLPKNTNFSLFGGSSGLAETRLVTSGTRGRFNHSFGISATRIGEQVERDSFRMLDSGGRAGVKINSADSLAFTVRLRHSRTRDFPASSGGPLFALNRQLETRKATSGLGGIEFRHAADRWSHVLEFDYFQQGQQQDTPAILDRTPPSFRTVPAIFSDTTFSRTRVNGSSSVRLARGWSGTMGGAYRYERGDNTGFIAFLGNTNYVLGRRTGGVFAETMLERKWGSAIASLRSDWISGAYDKLSPRLAATAAMPWRTARVRISWGRGFKLPSFYAIAHPLIGNRQLKPETNDAIDAGIEQSMGQALGIVSAGLYRSVYSSLVDFSPEQFRLVNRRKAIVHGIDLAWTLRRGSMTLQPHSTYSAARLEGTSEVLRDRPRWRAGTMFSYAFRRRATMYTDVLWVGKRFDFQVPVPQRDQAPSYLLMNAGGTYLINNSLSMAVRLDNVLNRHYQENVGFPAPGFQISMGLSYSLR